jgi:hypothetical protein
MTSMRPAHSCSRISFLRSAMASMGSAVGAGLEDRAGLRGRQRLRRHGDRLGHGHEVLDLPELQAGGDARQRLAAVGVERGADLRQVACAFEGPRQGDPHDADAGVARDAAGEARERAAQQHDEVVAAHDLVPQGPAVERRGRRAVGEPQVADHAVGRDELGVVDDHRARGVTPHEQRLELRQHDGGIALEGDLADERLAHRRPAHLLRRRLAAELLFRVEPGLHEHLGGARGVFGFGEPDPAPGIVVHDDLVARREELVEEGRHAPDAAGRQDHVVDVAVQHELTGLGVQVAIPQGGHPSGQIGGAGQIDGAHGWSSSGGSGGVGAGVERDDPGRGARRVRASCRRRRRSSSARGPWPPRSHRLWRPSGPRASGRPSGCPSAP